MKQGIALRLLIGGALLLYTLCGQAQDPRMSHPFMWKSMNNPGYSGFDGRMGVDMGFQKAFWGNPLDFTSYFLSADMPFNSRRTAGLGGVSMFFQRDQEGTLMYVTNSFGLSVSGRVKIMENTVLQLGLQPVIYQKSLDPSRIVLGDQLDSYYGKILNVSPNMIDFYKDKITLVDFAAGLYGRTNFHIKNGSFASVDYGFAVYHIIEPSQSFMAEQGSLSSQENLVNRRMSMYLSYTHPLVIASEVNTTVSPYLMYEKQGVISNMQMGAYWEEEYYGLVGIGFKNDQYNGLGLSSLLFHLGVNLSPETGMGWRICYTYEMPVNQGTVYKNTTHSLSLHWFLQKNPARENDRFANSPNNKRSYGRKMRCESGWFGGEGRRKGKRYFSF